MDRTKKQNLIIILILGALTTVSPFSIDMYLPVFPQIAAELGSSINQVSLSVSSYFIGLAFGQIFYGPILDRFGRKKPLYIGLTLFVVACVGCALSVNVNMLIWFRVLQALGGCAASVASLAMVRDFFPANDTSRIISLLMLILGVSPLLAPTVGSLLAASVGWQGIFILLAAIVVTIMAVAHFFLPEGHPADATISLKPAPIIKNFRAIFKNPQFHTYTLAGAFSFSGLFVYVAGSPIIFMGVFHVSAKIYGLIFAVLATGFIGGSQINIALLKHYSSARIFTGAVMVQAALGLVFILCTASGMVGLYETIGLTFLTLMCVGISSPNASALAMMPFSKNAGSASSLLGFIQLGIGATISTAVGLFETTGALPTVIVLGVTSWIALAVLLVNQRHTRAFTASNDHA